MIDIKRLRHLHAVATHRTVQAAAESLNLTQSALTKSIARFEEDLGAPLFDRNGHRLALTELGQRLVKRGENLRRQVQELEEEVSLWNGLGTGEVSVGVDPDAEFGVLPGVLKDFVPAHPKILVSLRSGHTETLLPALLNGELHFLVADAEVASGHEDLDIQPLAAAQIVAAVRPGHPLASDAQPTPDEVGQCPLIGASTAPRFEQWRTQNAASQGAEPFTPSLHSDNYEILARLAEETNAIFFGPRDVLKMYERAGRLMVMTWPLEGPDTQSSLIRSKGRHLSPAAKRLIDLVLRESTSATPTMATEV